MNNDHLVVTPPDRYWDDGFKLLLVDFDAYLLDQHFAAVTGSPVQVAVHVYMPDDNNPTWLMDVSASVDLVILNLGQSTTNDILKGRILGQSNVWYVGRPDLLKLWTRNTTDPVALMLIELEKHAKQGDKTVA